MMKRRRLADERGQLLIIVALGLVMLLGVTALSIDGAFMYDKRNKLYAAADAAAKSGAIEVHRNPSIGATGLQNFANQQVTAHGFDPATTTNVIVRKCDDAAATCAPAFAGNPNFVEAIVSEPTATFFAKVMGVFSLSPRARAVAGTGSSLDCIVTLGGPSASPESLSIGNAVLNMPGCNISDNGDLDTTNPNATINAASIAITGTCTGQNCPQANQQTGVTPATDPLATLPAPANPGGCPNVATVPGGGTPYTLNPGCYSKIDATATGINLTLNPGIYYITGPFKVGNNSRITGSGILLYFSGTAATGPCTLSATAGCVDVANGPQWTLTAATSGTYKAILMFQDPNDQLNASFDGNMGTSDHYDLSGAMYFPNADVSFRNGLNATNDCTLFVARSITIQNGNGTFSNVCAAYGGSPILTVSIAE